MPLTRELMGRKRLIMAPAEKGVPGVLMLGRYSYTSAQPGLSDHAHRDAIEICFLVKGCQTYCVGGEDYRLKGGDIFITFPNERHSTGGSPEEKGVLYWIILGVPRRSGDFLGLPKAQARALLKALLGVRPRHFRGSWKMKEHLDAMTELYHGEPGPLATLAMANRLEAFLLEVVACARLGAGRPTSRPLRPVLDYIDRHLGEPLNVPQLAERAKLSTARFKARFKQETGIPPGEYVLRAKIEEADRRLAAGGATVTQIAYDLGFSSSQYFATVFKRYTGRRPGDRREKAAGAGIEPAIRFQRI